MLHRQHFIVYQLCRLYWLIKELTVKQIILGLILQRTVYH